MKKNILHKQFPANFLIRNPLWGASTIFAFGLLFSLLYRPLGAHASGGWSYALTMTFYTLSGAVGVWIASLAMKKTSYFNTRQHWTIGREVLAIMICLLAMGMGVYLAGFVAEDAKDRLNWATLGNSMYRSVLVGLLPYAFFTLINLVSYRQMKGLGLETNTKVALLPAAPVYIKSQLKKESLSFLPEDFLFAESDGNYVMFHLFQEGNPKQVMIRNFISNIEIQLQSFPRMVRTHRAYIVNLDMVERYSGNSLGFRLKLKNREEEIPVSRGKTRVIQSLLQP